MRRMQAVCVSSAGHLASGLRRCDQAATEAHNHDNRRLLTFLASTKRQLACMAKGDSQGRGTHAQEQVPPSFKLLPHKHRLRTGSSIWAFARIGMSSCWCHEKNVHCNSSDISKITVNLLHTHTYTYFCRDMLYLRIYITDKNNISTQKQYDATVYYHPLDR